LPEDIRDALRLRGRGANEVDIAKACDRKRGCQRQREAATGKEEGLVSAAATPAKPLR
jgi:hypothetical protein